MKRVWSIASFVVLGAVAATSHAQPAPESMVREGLDLRRQRQDAEALAVLERALVLDPSARTRAQVALAEQALGLWVEAERDLTTALAAANDPWFGQHHGALELALQTIRTHLSTLEVATNLAGAQLRINGASVGVLPVASPQRVTAGKALIEVQAPDGRIRTTAIEVTPQSYVRERLDFPTIEAASRRVLETPAPGLRSSATVRSNAPFRGTPDLRTGAWIATGSAVALLLGAGVATLVQNTDAAVYNDDSRCFYGGLSRDQRCGGYGGAARIAQILAIAQFEAAAVAVGLSVVLFSLAPTPSRPPIYGLRCGVGVRIACSGFF